MPLPEDIKKMKIVPLGSFHDIKNDDKRLPDFLKGYKTENKKIEDFIEFDKLTDTDEDISTELNIKKTQGKNNYGYLRNNSFEVIGVTLFFNSRTHIVLKFDAKKGYKFFMAFSDQNREEGTVKENKNLFKEIKEKEKVCAIYTSQIGGCSYQTAFVGDNKKNPTYIIFSHLQRRSPLKQIIKSIKQEEKNILGIINVCFPETGSIKNSYHNLGNNTIFKRSITLVRNDYFWAKNHGSAFSIPFIGYSFEDKTKIKARILIGHDSSFLTLIHLTDNKDSFPTFNEFDEENILSIIQLKNLLKKTDKKNQEDIIKSLCSFYYNELFLKGKLGNKYLINNLEDEKIIELKNAFYTFWSSDFNDKYAKVNLLANILKAFPEYQDRNQIEWKSAIPIKEVIEGIKNYNPFPSENYYVNLGISNIKTFKRELEDYVFSEFTHNIGDITKYSKQLFESGNKKLIKVFKQLVDINIKVSELIIKSSKQVVPNSKKFDQLKLYEFHHPISIITYLLKILEEYYQLEIIYSEGENKTINNLIRTGSEAISELFKLLTTINSKLKNPNKK